MMEKSKKLPRDYDGSQYGIDLNSTTTQPMAEDGPTHDVLQETVYGWLKGNTMFVVNSQYSCLTYSDFVEHIGCDAQEYRYKSLGNQRAYTWVATDKPFAKFGAFFRENDEGVWTIWATGSSQIDMPDDYIENLKNSNELKEK